MPTRRQFLKTTAGLALGTVSLPTLIPSEMPSTSSTQKKLGICLVGLGDYATSHLAPGIAQSTHCRVAGLVTGSAYKFPLWKEKYGLPESALYGYYDWDRIAQNPDIDVVYVVTPTAHHAEFAIKAANAGKHVWCEKPMAMTALECKAVIDACKHNNVSLAIGYRLHHEPNLIRFKRWATERPYGPIKKIFCDVGWEMSPNPNSWQMSKELGGGHLYDLGVYVVNGLRLAAQEEPIAVTATHTNTRPYHFRGVPEETLFTLEFPSGVVGHGKYTARETVNRLEVQCERGWYKLDQLYMMYNGLNGGTSDGQVFKDEVSHQQRTQVDAEAAAILAGQPPIVPGSQGLNDVHILECINLSARYGQRILL
jgi:predicted dehydrogenase